ncbi:hypothetical protein GCM10009804_41230 [Kribbella hippodromi]|uniref:PPE family protein n=1 Tax=Kribbella hippodromi TaxID=434347 RepID=A0ABN2DM00_9ACTN
MSTPSEGPGPQNTGQHRIDQQLMHGGFTQEQRTAIFEIINTQRALEARQAELAAKQPVARARRIAPYGLAAGAAAMTEPGQEALGWTGDQIAAGAQAVGDWAGQQADATGQEANHFADWAGQQVDNAVQTTKDFGNWAGDQLTSAGHAISEGAQSAGHAISEGTQAAAGAVSGWAVQTWDSAVGVANSVGDTAVHAAHQVGAWATQYADAIAANPSQHAATAAVAVGAVVAATPQLRQAVGRAANAASRWGKAAASAVANAPGAVADRVSKLYNAIRRNPDTQQAAETVNPREMAVVANEITAPAEPKALPAPAEMKAIMPPGSDPAMRPAGTKQLEQATGGENTVLGQQAGERPGTQRGTDPKSTGNNLGGR